MEEDIYRTDPQFLAPLMGVDGKEPPKWQPGELGDILRHQLQSPLFLNSKLPSNAKIAGDDFSGEALKSFGDLFTHPTPPLALLVIVKDFAKSSDARENTALPPEIATVLYLGVIVIARLRHDAGITALKDDELNDGVAWALQQQWLEPITRGLFEEYKTLLAHPASVPAQNRE